MSRDFAKLYSVVSHDPTAAAGTYIAYLQNTSTTENMVIDLVRVGGVASILWKMWFVTGTAAGGNALTPVNYNRTSSSAALATARGDDSITGLTADGQISTIRNAANTTTDIRYDATLILGQNDALAIEADAVTSTAIAEAFIRFYYEKHNNL